MATVPSFAIVPALPKGHEATPTRGGMTQVWPRVWRQGAVPAVPVSDAGVPHGICDVIGLGWLAGWRPFLTPPAVAAAAAVRPWAVLGIPVAGRGEGSAQG
jgi:hypothetical protein